MKLEIYNETMFHSRRIFLVSFLGALSSLVFGADIPRPVTEFAMQMPNGSKTLLSTYRGKPIVFAFIQTTCPHCQKATQMLTKLQQEYGPRGVQFLACAFNDDANVALPSFLMQYKPTFPIGWSNRDAVFSFLQISMMKPGYVPKFIFVDKSGTIRAQHDGDSSFFSNEEQNTRNMLDEMLKGSGKPKS